MIRLTWMEITSTSMMTANRMEDRSGDLVSEMLDSEDDGSTDIVDSTCSEPNLLACGFLD